MSTVTDKGICQIIAEVLPKAAVKGGVSPAMDLRGDLGVDSVALMSIVFVIEEKLGFDAFSHVQEFIEAERVSDIIDIVRRG